MPQPKNVLLEIIVSGAATPQVFSYYDRVLVTGPLQVNVGDRVAWFVTVAFADGRRSLPYTVNFTDTSFFGVSSLPVAAGGTSPFLQVLALKGSVSYSLDVTGIGCVFDPEIQSGSGNLVIYTPARHDRVSTFTVTWDTNTNVMTYTKGGAPGTFPIKVSDLDTVTFIATAGSNFSILFAPNFNLWASPFDPNTSQFPAAAGALSLGPLTVTDNADGSGTQFFFSGSIVVNNKTVTSPSYEIDLA